VRTAAETFVPNPKLDVAQVISQLGVGEALVSVLQESGAPTPVERTLICPPRCRMGAITPEERAAVRGRSPVGAKYDAPVNRQSAYELLSRRAEEAAGEEEASRRREGRAEEAPGDEDSSQQRGRKERVPSARERKDSRGDRVNDMLWGTKRRQGMVETMAKQAARTVGSQVGRQIIRGILGGILGKSRR